MPSTSPSPHADRHAETAPFAILVILIAGCFLMGGGSRGDITSLLILQPMAAVCLCTFLLIPGTRDWCAVRVPLAGLGAMAAIMAVQLVPLPPAVWAALPGHERIAATAQVLGLDDVWRPLSASPDLTVASLTGLVVPLAILVGFANLGRRRRFALVALVIAGALASALLGLAQITGGDHGRLYTYAVTNHGSAVGLLANRNHQAVLLAMTIPFLAAWANGIEGSAQRRHALRWTAFALVVLLIPLILVTGSRAGIVFGIFGVIGAAIIWSRRSGGDDPKAAARPWAKFAAVVMAAAVLAATILLSRAVAITRLLALDTGTDPRTRATPVGIQMALDHFPTGSGFGTFEPLFRYYEPEAIIDDKYLNHAHNDILEVVITGGLPALLVVAWICAWIARRSVAVFKPAASTPEGSLAQASSIALSFVLASSLVDYPLRTPLMMAIVALACGWLGSFRSVSR